MSTQDLQNLPNIAEPVPIAASERENSLRDAIALVRTFGNLPENWDSYGGSAATERAIGFAEALLETAARIPDLIIPYVAPISRGVFVQWKSGRADLYFEIDEASVLSVVRDDVQIIYSAEDSTFSVRMAFALIEHFHHDAK